MRKKKEIEYLTVQEAADYLQVSPRLIRKFIYENKIKALKIEGSNYAKGFIYIVDKAEIVSLERSRTKIERPVIEDGWISLKEAAKLYRCPVAEIKKKIEDKTLEARKVTHYGVVKFRYLIKKIKQEEFNKPLFIPVPLNKQIPLSEKIVKYLRKLLFVNP